MSRTGGARRVGSWAVAVLLSAGACGSSGPPLAPLEDSGGTAPAGFSSTLVELTERDGTTCERCLLLAAAAQERSRGLMGVTTLGGYDGMVFTYPAPKVGAFWMKDTVLPLTIVFYDQDGAALASFDMPPCRADPCPQYGPDRAFTAAVEVEAGRAVELGFTPGARLEVLGLPCDPPVD